MPKKIEKIERRRDLPHNTEAEKAVLGAMLRSKTICDDCISEFTEESFFAENVQNRIVFGAMYRCRSKNEPVDVQTVTQELINMGAYDDAGGTEYLLELVDSVISLENVKEYVNAVKDQELLRKFLGSMNEAIEYYYTHDIESISDFVGSYEKKLSEVAEKRRVADFQRAEDISERVSNEIKDLKATSSDDEVTGVPTGYTRLNQLTHGWQKDQLIILAARTGIGKTALSLNLAYHAAMNDKPTAYFSLEMSSSELWKRLISADANIEHNTLVSGFNLTNAVRQRVQESCRRLAKTKLYIDDTSGLTILDLIAKARKLKNNYEPNLSLIIVDYIGLVHSDPNRKFGSRQEEVQYVSQSLKNLAKELHVPIIAVAQLNRNADMRGGKGGIGDPQISDLRESGSLEQDADIIMLLSTSKSEEVKDSKENVFEQKAAEVNSKQAEIAKKEGGADTVLVKVNIAKNRAGSQGNAFLLFRKAYCEFSNLTKEGEEQLNKLESERINYIAAD